jgi:malyl-CoA/(S)-citramalyl-CoA lyase
MVDACAAAGILPFYGPVRRHQGRRGLRGAVPRRVPDGLRRRLVAAPAQIDIAKKVFSPDPTRSLRQKVIEAIPDGRGVHMIDGKMQDDATWKQCKVMVGLAEIWPRRIRSCARLTGCSRAGADYAVTSAGEAPDTRDRR